MLVDVILFCAYDHKCFVFFFQKTGKDELTQEEKYQKRKAEQDARAKERRDREPMLLVKFITNHPKKAFGKKS